MLTVGAGAGGLEAVGVEPELGEGAVSLLERGSLSGDASISSPT